MKRYAIDIFALFILMTAGFQVGLAQTNTFPSSGNVGIGTTNPYRNLDIHATQGSIGINSTDTKASYINFVNPQGLWQLSGPRSYEAHNTFSIFWYVSGAYHRYFSILDNGNVGIGTFKPTATLAVNGTTKSKEMIVTNNASDWPDYVFHARYKIPGLKEIESYIKKYKHLPGIPSKDKIERVGQNLGVMQIKLLKQIEELTLQNINQQKQLVKQGQLIRELERRVDKLESQGHKN